MQQREVRKYLAEPSLLVDWYNPLLESCWCLDIVANQNRQTNNKPIQV